VQKLFPRADSFFSSRAFFVFVQLLLSPSRLVMGPQCAFFSSAGGEKNGVCDFFCIIPPQKIGGEEKVDYICNERFRERSGATVK